MKKIIFVNFIFLLLLLAENTIAQTIINKGGKIIIKENSTLILKGNYINQLSGNIHNNGFFHLTGDLTNNATGGNFMQWFSGEVFFNGSTPQYINGTSATYFNKLNIQSNVQVNTNINVLTELKLLDYSIIINNSSLRMEYGSSFIGISQSAYVKTVGSGKLIQMVGPWDQFYPIGTSISYCPVTINNHINDSYGYYSVNVFPDVLDGGNSGATITEIDNCVNLTWNIEAENPLALDLSVTTQWNGSDAGPSFDHNHAGAGHFTGGVWDPMLEEIASGSDPYFITRNDINSLSPFAVGDLESPMAVEDLIRIDLKAFLEGPYIGGGVMNSVLNSNGYIPLSQPYSPTLPYYDISNITDLKWYYNGSENVPSIPPGVVDWVVVQLRDADSPGNASSATIIGTKAGFVLDNGSIVDLDGSTNLTFDVNFTQNIYAVVFHRNHLGIISNNSLTESGGIYSYDFSSGEFQVYGGANGHKQMETGVWAMIAADGNGNGLIQNTDETAVWKTDLGNSGYMGGDFDMNGLTQNTDETNYWKINLGGGGQVPNKNNGTGYKSQVPD